MDVVMIMTTRMNMMNINPGKYTLGKQGKPVKMKDTFKLNDIYKLF